MSRHPVTGCRIEQLFGIWMMDLQVFDELKNRVYEIVDAGKLVELREKQDENPDQSHSAYEYDVQDDVAVVNLSGTMTKYETSFTSLLGGTSTLRMKRTFRAMLEDPRVKGAMVLGDTPGGNALGMADLANTFRMFNERKPLVWHNAGLTNSGGYWLASQCRRITSEPNCMTGSVGGFCMLTDRSENLKRQGIKVHAVKVGEFKAAAMPGTEITPKQLEYFEAQVKDQVQPFYADVREGRRFSEAQMNEVILAKSYESTPALKHGIIDGIMFEEEALDRFKHEVKSGNVARGRITVDKPQSAASKETPMPLPAEVLNKVKALPGATNVTEENATQVAADIATKLNDQVVDLNAKLEKAPKIKTLDEETIKEKIGMKNERLDIMVEGGFLTKAQADHYKAAMKDDPQGWLVARVEGKKAPIDQVIDGAKLVKMKQGDGEKTKEQVKESQPEDEQNKDTKTEVNDPVEQGKKQAEAYKQKRLQERGITTK